MKLGITVPRARRSLAMDLAVVAFFAVGLTGCTAASPEAPAPPAPAASPAGVTTLAGSGRQGFADGPGGTAMFGRPARIAVDDAGNVYVADSANHRIRKVTKQGQVTTLAGSGTAGFADGPGTVAQFHSPGHIAVDRHGVVYVSDQKDVLMRTVAPDGTVQTLAGSRVIGFADGPGATAQFSGIAGVAVDTAGNVYVADVGNNRIRKIDPRGIVSTLAGSGEQGYADGAAAYARFTLPCHVAVDVAGNVYVVDGPGRIRMVSPAGVVSTVKTYTVAGAILAGLTVDQAGTLYVTDMFESRIISVSPRGKVAVVAGSGSDGFTDGPAATARFSSPEGVAVAPDGTIYVGDVGNARIRAVRLG